MNYKIETTNNFLKELKPLAKKYRSLKTDLLILNESLKQNPTQGVSLGRGCYKIRLQISSKGKGKSSGARVITYVKVVRQTIFLLSIFDKSITDNISDKQLSEILKIADLNNEA